MLDMLRHHPIWLHDQGRRRALLWPTVLTSTAVAAALYGVLALLLCPFNAIEAPLVLYLLVFTIGCPLMALGRGFNVLARERAQRRLELLQTTPLPVRALVVGTWLTALRDVVERVVGVAVPLLLAGGAAAALHGGRLFHPVQASVAAVLFTLVISVCTCTWGLLLAILTGGNESRAGAAGVAGLATYLVLLLVLNQACDALPPAVGNTLSVVNPVWFFRAVLDSIDYTWQVPYGIFVVPALFYGVASAALLYFSVDQ